MDNTNIIKALIKAQGELKEVAKDGSNTHFNYKYATLQSYLQEIRPVLEPNGLSIVTSIEDVREMQEGRMLVKMKVSLYHESGESLDTFVFGEGQDISAKGKIGDKAIYKAITGGKKYALANLFNIATTDDPEKDVTTHKDKTRPVADMTKASPLECSEHLFVEEIQHEIKEIKNRKYDIWTVTFSDKNVYSTTKKIVADECQKMLESEEECMIEWQKTEYGLGLLSICEQPLF